MYILNINDFVKKERDNYVFWVKIAHFIIETNGKRIFFINIFLPRETKIPFEGFYILFFSIFVPKGLLFLGRKHMSTDQTTLKKKHFTM